MNEVFFAVEYRYKSIIGIFKKYFRTIDDFKTWLDCNSDISVVSISPFEFTIVEVE